MLQRIGWAFRVAWIGAVAFVLLGGWREAEARRPGVEPWCDTILSATTLTASTPVTTTAVPVGNAEDASISLRIRGVGPTDTVTITTLALESTDDSVAGYELPVGVASQRVLSPNANGVVEGPYPVGFPPSVESLKFTIEVGPGAGASLEKVVGCSL